jgi:hypothetical protein
MLRSCSDHCGQMKIKVVSKVLDKFLHDNLLVKLDEKTQEIKELQAGLSVFGNDWKILLGVFGPYYPAFGGNVTVNPAFGGLPLMPLYTEDLEFVGIG